MGKYYKMMTSLGMDSVFCGDCLTRAENIIDPCRKCKKYTKHVYGKMLNNPNDSRWTPSTIEIQMGKNTIHSFENSLTERRGF